MYSWYAFMGTLKGRQRLREQGKHEGAAGGEGLGRHWGHRDKLVPDRMLGRAVVFAFLMAIAMQIAHTNTEEVHTYTQYANMLTTQLQPGIL